METTPFNPIEALSDELIAEYLTEAFEDDDPQFFAQVLANVVKHKGVSSIAAQTGMSRESLYKFVKNPQPTWRTVHKILHTLGVKLEWAA